MVDYRERSIRNSSCNKTFFNYLYGTNFTIVTDHRPLEALISKKESSGRLAKWSLF